MNQIITLLSADSFVRILLVAVTLDTILGVLRAIKEHKFNSSVGIDGAIRKTAMLTSTGLLMAIDVIMHINVLFMVPETYIKVLGISKLGICEFFCLLFILYELVSILKNMTLCGLPVPSGVKKWIQKFLEDMTEELIDRFGDIPKKVEKLLEVAALKAQAHQLYVTAVEQKGEVYTFTMYEKAKVHPERIPKLIEDFRGELTFKADGVQPCFIYEKKRRNLKEKQTDALESTKNVLNGLKRLIGEEKSGIIDPLSK